MDYLILVLLMITSFNIYQRVLNKGANYASIKVDYKLIHLIFIRLKNVI
jgi:hypothetical protein